MDHVPKPKIESFLWNVTSKIHENLTVIEISRLKNMKNLKSAIFAPKPDSRTQFFKLINVY